MANRQSNSYQGMMEHYDDLLTGRKWWSRLYMRLIWNQDANLLARKVLDFIPNDFQGRLLDVPVGTAVFTAEKYRQMKDVQIETSAKLFVQDLLISSYFCTFIV